VTFTELVTGRVMELVGIGRGTTEWGLWAEACAQRASLWRAPENPKEIGDFPGCFANSFLAMSARF